LHLAWADTTLNAVLPFGVIARADLKLKLKDLSELIAKERIQKVIVGFPVGLTGAENANTERVKRFVFELEKQIDVPVELVDERFTSQAADRLGSAGASRDEKAAMIILEGYLARTKL
jgi:putative Holliday junction resolvase